VGMSAVRGIVQKLGGDITLRSSWGQGTRVELRGPASRKAKRPLVVFCK
jgi:chemotaxis protein histidine kinase CheA